MKKQIWVKAEYDNYYKLINKVRCIISIHEIKKYNNYVLIKIDTTDYEKLKKYIVSYKFEIIESTGLYYLINLVKKNKLIFITSILGLILFLILNNIIVSVEVLHESKEIRNILYNELDNYNISVLTFKKNYEEIQEIKKEILNNNEDKIDWLEIEIVGMKYIIRAEERIITNLTEENEYCNVYASKNGMITSISISSGISMVKIGDYVNQGDILISGDILLNDELKDEVCASGTVHAESWYETSIKVPFEYYEYTNTGISRYNLIYEYNGEEKRILNDRISNYKSNKVILFDLFSRKLYLEKQYEIKKEYLYYSEEEALEKALKLNEEKILLKINDKDTIIDQKVLKKTINNSTIEVEIFTITNEIISK
ncbi:MAG: sporulation protein YqfD [bacterium]